MGSLTLEDLRIEDMSFPHSVLAGCETALCVFAAGFLGRQDAFWVADAGLRATVVDSDPMMVKQMRKMYPPSWDWRIIDAYRFATDEEWDVVTLDPWTNQFQLCADHLPAWCRMARHAVVLGTGIDTDVVAPPGWEITDVRQRSDYDGGVFWTVLEPT